jgi:PAS domain S-box-containing protein
MSTQEDRLRGLLEAKVDGLVPVDARGRAAPEEQLRALTDAAPCHVFMKDRDRRWTFANPALLRAHGLALEDVLGKTDAELFGAGPVADAIAAVDREVLSTEREIVAEERVPTAAGMRLFVSHKAPLRGPDGAVVGLVGAALDVTDARRAEAALRDRARYHDTLFHRSLDAIWVVDMQGRIVDANAAATTLTGFAREELLGRTPWDLAGGSAEMVRRGVARLQGLPGKPGERFTTRLVQKSGAAIDVDVVIQHLDVDGGRVVSFVRDVTEQRRVEEQLRQAQKLESVGRLAGGVAHDFNNLLTVILGATEGRLEDVEAGLPARLDDLRAVLHAGQHARGLTRQLLAFARRQPVATVALDLSDVVRAARRSCVA